MIKGIHFDTSLRMVFTRGGGAYNRMYFFVCLLEVNGPITGRAYYAPSPLFLDQTEEKKEEKNFFRDRPLPPLSKGLGLFGVVMGDAV